ncbi:hypothetical protein P7K49_025684 [Saguinus oedipus]|uniref:Uncharacterized protein n=1 Tax=Saguinus oedipus TaxID=9490 RepID=A0ABQ9UHW1_SAGOE|nr:hypothetical protein P7K49_025684 [Saguinus oedipus]
MGTDQAMMRALVQDSGTGERKTDLLSQLQDSEPGSCWVRSLRGEDKAEIQQLGQLASEFFSYELILELSRQRGHHSTVGGEAQPAGAVSTTVGGCQKEAAGVSDNADCTGKAFMEPKEGGDHLKIRH